MSEMCRVDQQIGAPSLIPGVSQKLTIGSSSVQSAAFQTVNALGRATTWIRFITTSNCWISFGTNPTATALPPNSFYFPTGLCDYHGVPPGATHLAVIQDSAAGVLHLLEGL